MTSDYRQEAIRALSQLSTMMHMGNSRDMAARLQNRAHVLEISAMAEELEVERTRLDVAAEEEKDRLVQDAWYENELKHRGGTGVESPYTRHHQAAKGGAPGSPTSLRRHYRSGVGVSFSGSPKSRNGPASPGAEVSARSTQTGLKASYGITKAPSDAAQALIRSADHRTTGPAARAIETQIALAETYAKTGRIHDAIDLMRRALTNYEDKVCRGNLRHPSLLPILMRLAELVEETGDSNEARCIRDRVRHIGQDVIGINNESKFSRVLRGEKGLLEEMGGPDSSTYADNTFTSSPGNGSSFTRNNSAHHSPVAGGNNSFSRNTSRGSNLSASPIGGGPRGVHRGDASPGSVASARKRNVFTYSFLSQQHDGQQ